MYNHHISSVGIEISSSQCHVIAGRDEHSGRVKIETFRSEDCVPIPHEIHGAGTQVRVTDAVSTSAAFCALPAYREVARAALQRVANHQSYAAHVTVDSLVLGLPIAHQGMATSLEEWLTGVHYGQKTYSIQVKKARVVPRPIGVYVYRGAHVVAHNGMSFPTLVLDLSADNFEWMIGQGDRPHYASFGSSPIGVRQIAVQLAGEMLQTSYVDESAVQLVARALSESRPTVTIGEREFQLDSEWRIADGHLRCALGEMLNVVGSLRTVGEILLTGEGAELLIKPIERLSGFPSESIRCPYWHSEQNVMGYHMIAEAMNLQRMLPYFDQEASSSRCGTARPN